jgi:hypothetical protein
MSPARTLTAAELAEHTPAELRLAFATLPLRRMSFDDAMADPVLVHLVRCRARDIKNRAAAQRPSGYRPTQGDLVATVEAAAERRKRARLADDPNQQPLFLASTAP